MTFSLTVFHGSSWSNSWNTIIRSGPGPRHGLALQPDLAFDRLHVAADRLQQRRLAAAGRPEQDEAIGAIHVEVDAIRRRDEMVARLVLQRHAAHVKQRAVMDPHACGCRARALPPSAGGDSRLGTARRRSWGPPRLRLPPLRCPRASIRVLGRPGDAHLACHGRRSRSTLPPLTMMPTRLPATSSVRSSRHASGTGGRRLDDHASSAPTSSASRGRSPSSLQVPIGVERARESRVSVRPEATCASRRQSSCARPAAAACPLAKLRAASSALAGSAP